MLAGAARAEERLTPNHLWEGEFREEKLKQEAPKGGVITDAKAFAKLWKAWRKDEAVPEVDFTKEFAFVAICSTKGERPVPWATLKDGVLSVSWDAARRGQGGWGYAILAFDRKEVKKVNGVELEPAKPKPEGPEK
jgi:hypothetical protein